MWGKTYASTCGIRRRIHRLAPTGLSRILVNLTDAIRQHGNQAQPARDAFMALTPGDKNKLIAFLLSL